MSQDGTFAWAMEQLLGKHARVSRRSSDVVLKLGVFGDVLACTGQCTSVGYTPCVDDITARDWEVWIETPRGFVDVMREVQKGKKARRQSWPEGRGIRLEEMRACEHVIEVETNDYYRLSVEDALAVDWVEVV